MKILMLLDSEFPPDIRVENEISALSEAGHEVHLACTTRKNLPDKEQLNGAVIHRKEMSTFIYKSSVGCLKFPFYFNYWRQYISDLFKRERFDVIHVHDLPLSRIGAEVKMKYKLPLVLDLHENWPALLKHAAHTQTIAGRVLSSDRQWISYEKEMLHQADLVVTIVEEAGDRIASLGLETDKICIVSNTANTEKIPVYSRKRSDNEFILFYGGGINRHRGLQVVVEAIRMLRDRDINVKLQIAGSGSYKDTLEKQVAEAGLRPTVIFYGQKPFNDMLELLAEADAAIIPHLRNENNDASSPNKLFQYMYLKVPVISSDCTSLKRIIGETDAGFVYRNDSPYDLAALLEKLYTDRRLLAEKGLKGRMAVFGKYSWDYDKARLIEAYSRFITRPSG
ncbi:MAG: glycosyltransferase family 4 protein [Bacteroidales bacterium]|nr:glycosyltransferase family 4 protein [Bacteroidales bacterium]